MKSPLRNGFLRLSVACAAVLALVVPSAAQALPEGYAYEKVSPAEKGNGEIAGGEMFVSGFRASEDGGSILYPANSVFAGAVNFAQVNAYAGIRQPESWTLDSLSRQVPYKVPPIPSNIFADAQPKGFSADGTTTVVGTNQDPETGSDLPGTSFYALHVADGNTERITPEPVSGDPNVTLSDGQSSVAGNDDFSKMLYSTTSALTADAATVSSGDYKLYHYEDGVTALASRDRDGNPMPGVSVDSQGSQAMRNGFSEDGTVYWYHRYSGFPSERPIFRGDVEDGFRSNAVNASENTGAVVPLQTATFQGASLDGNRAFFSSPQKLTDDTDPADGTNLYLYEHSEDPEADQNLSLISEDLEPVDGTNPLVQDVLGTDDEARVVYFTASSQLVPGEPVAPGEKLYRWDGGTLEYLATAAITPLRRTASVTPDGRYLLAYSAASGLTPDDNGGHQQLYIYDAQEAEFTCASCVPGGVNENDVIQLPLYNLMNITDQPRRVFADDGRVFFVTADRLLVEDINGEADLYTFKGGELDLVSSGTGAGTGIRFADASEDGSTVFFRTREQLVEWDTDTKADLYAARLNGGQPAPAIERPEEPCQGDDCQGEGPTAPVDPEDGSSDYAGSGNPKTNDCSALSRTAQQAKQKAKRLKGKTTKAKQRVRRAKGKPKAKKLKKMAQKQAKRAKKASKNAKRQKSKLAECRRGS